MWHFLYIITFFGWFGLASWLEASVPIIMVGFVLMTLAGFFAAMDVRGNYRSKRKDQ